MKKKMIVIEGLDGSGKATQAKLLAESLRAGEMRVRQVSFPNYQSDSSALVRMYLNGEFGTRPDDVNAYAASSFYAVDRYAGFKKDWGADYEQGLVIADRYTTSNAIHQCSKLSESAWDAYLDWLFSFEYRLLALPAPSLVVYLRVDPAVSQRLLLERYRGREEKKDIHEKDTAYLERCWKAADYCAEKLGWTVIDCCEDGAMRPVEEIQREILAVIRRAEQAWS